MYKIQKTLDIYVKSGIIQECESDRIHIFKKRCAGTMGWQK